MMHGLEGWAVVWWRLAAIYGLKQRVAHGVPRTTQVPGDHGRKRPCQPPKRLVAAVRSLLMKVLLRPHEPRLAMRS